MKTVVYSPAVELSMRSLDPDGVWRVQSWFNYMGKKLYVGNLANGVTDQQLEQLFGQHGSVRSAQVIMDRDSGRSKGFGFVEMGSDDEARSATTAPNLREVEGRSITVNEARPRMESGSRSRRY